ncbi:MAG: tetratricopeptide repeat protein, partial [bacterium]
DIWSFSVMLYEMITGQLPFKGEYEQAVMYSIMNEDPEPITALRTGVPLELEGIVFKALAKNPEERYQHVDEMLADLKRIRKELGTPGRIQPPKIVKRESRKKRFKRILIPVGIVLFLVLGFLLLRPLLVEQVLVSEPKPIAVISFENQTGDRAYDYLQKAIPNLLITSLEQSKYLRVTTWQRMHDLLKQMGREDVETIDEALGFELSRMDGIDAIVLGSFTKAGDVFATDVKVLDVNSKRLLKSASSKGEGVASILKRQIDELSREISRGVGISERKIEATQRRITDVTTTSIEAYKYYIAGGEAAFRMYHQEAIGNLEKAVALDSSFTEAYDALARQYYTVGEYAKALRIIEKVRTFPGKLTEERLAEILALEAYINQDWDLAINYLKRLIRINPENIVAHFDLGMVYYRRKMMYEEGISEFKKVLKLDPQGVTRYSSFTYNVLGYAYLRKGEWKKALAAFKKYVALLPNQADPLDSLGDFYRLVGDYDRAIANFQRALEIKPDYLITYVHLGDTYLAKGMYREALRCYEKYLALPLSEAQQGEAHFYLGKLYFLKGDNHQAIQECRHALELNLQMIQAHWIQGLTFVKKEMFDQAENEALTINGLIQRTKTEELKKAYYYHLVAELFFSKSLYQQALDNFNKAANIESLERTFFVNALGEAYLRVGKLEIAAEKLEAVLKLNQNYAQSHYLLGLVYEKKGKKEKAREHFQRFMDIWQDADENLPQLIDAKKRLQEL